MYFEVTLFILSDDLKVFVCVIKNNIVFWNFMEAVKNGCTQ